MTDRPVNFLVERLEAIYGKTHMNRRKWKDTVGEVVWLVT